MTCLNYKKKRMVFMPCVSFCGYSSLWLQWLPYSHLDQVLVVYKSSHVPLTVQVDFLVIYLSY